MPMTLCICPGGDNAERHMRDWWGLPVMAAARRDTVVSAVLTTATSQRELDGKFPESGSVYYFVGVHVGSG